MTFTNALIISAKAHAGQLDKQGQSFIFHPIFVAMCVPVKLRIPAILHDVVEDTNITLEELSKRMSDKNAKILDALTRRENEKYFSYIKRVAKNKNAIKIKLVDLEHNMLPIRKPTATLLKRYNKAKNILSQVSFNWRVI